MDRERGSKVIAIIALCFAVVGVSLGFAAFASDLKINSSANVKPNASTFNVDFSTTSGSVVAGSVTGKGTGATAGTASIDNSKTDSVIKDISATFSEPGQSVTYTFYAHNDGQFDAYLNTVTFADVADQSEFKICTPGTGTTASMVATACNNISLSVKVGTQSFTSSSANIPATHKLEKNTSEEVVVTIQYTGDAVADGDFNVSFGEITLGYDSVDEIKK